MKKPTHEEISHRAHKIWQDTGSSAAGGADDHWLEAERQLSDSAAKPHSDSPAAEHPVAGPLSEAKSDHAVAERATQQRKAAREPKVPTHTAPKQKPAETGKPLWNQPHSS